MNKIAYLKSLQESHSKLDEQIKGLGPYAHLRISFLKKQKLMLKEKIVKLENELNENSNTE